MPRESLLHEVHQRLGYRRLNRAWAKAEILLGLIAAGVGVFLGQYSVVQSPALWQFLVAALGLFVLGGYLTLAGHRSHLYQSENDRVVLLLEELRQLHGKDSPS